MKKILMILVLATLPLGGAFAEQPDARRLAAAKKWYQTLQSEAMIDSVLQYLASFQPADKRAAYLKTARESFEYNDIEKIATERSASVFTVKDLEAMNRFYGTREGKAIAKKLARYLIEVIPAVQVRLFYANQAAMKKLK